MINSLFLRLTVAARSASVHLPRMRHQVRTPRQPLPGACRHPVPAAGSWWAARKCGGSRMNRSRLPRSRCGIIITRDHDFLLYGITASRSLLWPVIRSTFVRDLTPPIHAHHFRNPRF